MLFLLNSTFSLLAAQYMPLELLQQAIYEQRTTRSSTVNNQVHWNMLPN